MGAEQLSAKTSILSGFVEIYTIRTRGRLAFQSWTGARSPNRKFRAWFQSLLLISELVLLGRHLGQVLRAAGDKRVGTG